MCTARILAPFLLFLFSSNTRATMPINKARLDIQNNVDFGVLVYVQYSNATCWQCPEQLLGDVQGQSNLTILIDSRRDSFIKIYHNNSMKQVCASNKNLTSMKYCEHSTRTVYINDHQTCVVIDDDGDPLGGLLPILIAALCFAMLACLWIVLKYCYRNNLIYRVLFCMETDRLVNSDLGIPSHHTDDDDSSKGRTGRLKSLDAFRGFSLVIMIFVNYGGGQYWFFNHSAWNGLTVADLVFPWFIFIMGTAMALSFSSLQRKNVARKKLFWKIVSRTVVLFILGLIISNNTGNDLTKLRIPGVLQRFAATYFVVALMELCFAHGAVDQYQYKWWALVRDVVIFWHEWLISLLLVVVWLCLTFLLDVDEGCQKGYLGPGGIHQNHSHHNCTGGAAGYIDRWLLGANHIYQTPTCSKVYQTTIPYDPEGVLGTLTSIFLCFLGLQEYSEAARQNRLTKGNLIVEPMDTIVTSGKILLMYRDWKQRVVRWLVWALILGVISGILCNFSQNDGPIPVNKNLWSLSYVTTMACFAFILLAIFYVTIDVYKVWSGAPFFYPGMNPILIYCGSEVLANYFPISFTVPGMDTHAAQLAVDIWGTTFWVLVAVYLHQKEMFFSV